MKSSLRSFSPFHWFKMMEGWLATSTIFQPYQDDAWTIMKDCLQWNSIYGWEDFASSGARTRDCKIISQTRYRLRFSSRQLPKNSVVRLTDRPDMTLAVNHGRKASTQQQLIKQKKRRKSANSADPNRTAKNAVYILCIKFTSTPVQSKERKYIKINK